MGLASLLLNISTVMVFGIVALYFKQALGATAGIIILLESGFEAMAYFMKLFSGMLSDYLGKRRSIMLWGIIMMTISKLIFAFFTAIPAILGARLLERVGNGIQATPRDALVGDLAPPHSKGACFGLRQSLAIAGSFLGSIFGIVVMSYTNQDINQVFLWAALPGILAILIIIFFVHDTKPTDTEQETQKSLEQTKKPFSFYEFKKNLSSLGKSYWLLMVVVVVFMSARIGESVLMLHATENYGLDPSFSHAIVLLYNCTNSVFSYPIGLLSDRLGRYGFLILSFTVLILADLFLGFSETLPMMLVGVALWGIQIGMSQDMFLCLIADQVPRELRGTAIGFFYLITALALLVAGKIGGELADRYDQFTTFLGSGAIASISLLLLVVLLLTNQLESGKQPQSHVD
jgi:MFS family permease